MMSLAKKSLFQNNINIQEFDQSDFPKADALVLEENEIHLWKISSELLSVDFKNFYNTLDAKEQCKVNKYPLHEQQKRLILRYGALRKLLGGYLNLDPASIILKHGENKKPVLKNSQNNNKIHFSLSHTKNLLIIGFSRSYKIGVDVEYLENISDADALAEQYFSDSELSVFRSLPHHKKTESFFNCWTRKQAFVKAAENHLQYPLNSFDVAFALGETAQLLRVDGKPQEASRWIIQAFKPAPNYTGAIAARYHDYQLKMYDEWQKSYSGIYQLAA